MKFRQYRLFLTFFFSLALITGCSSIPFISDDDEDQLIAEADIEEVEAKKEKQAPVDINSTVKKEGEAYSPAEQYDIVTRPKLINSEYFLKEQAAGGHRGARQRQEAKDKEKQKIDALQSEIDALKEAMISLKKAEDQGGIDYQKSQPASTASANSCSKEDVTFYIDKGFTTDQITQICGG